METPNDYIAKLERESQAGYVLAKTILNMKSLPVHKESDERFRLGCESTEDIWIAKCKEALSTFRSSIDQEEYILR